MENIRKQLSMFKNDDINGLMKSFMYASDDIKNYDFLKATSAVFGFIMKIKESKFIDIDNDIVEFRIKREELLGYPSINIMISDASTYEPKYVFSLDVIHRNKDRFILDNLVTNQKSGFNTIDLLLTHINKKED